MGGWSVNTWCWYVHKPEQPPADEAEIATETSWTFAHYMLPDLKDQRKVSTNRWLYMQTNLLTLWRLHVIRSEMCPPIHVSKIALSEEQKIMNNFHAPSHQLQTQTTAGRHDDYRWLARDSDEKMSSTADYKQDVSLRSSLQHICKCVSASDDW